MEDCPLPDLRDIELKLGRKVPESLVRSLRGEEPVPWERDGDPCGGSCAGGGCSTSSSSCSFPVSLSSSSSSSPTSGSPRRGHSSSVERLETKLHHLRQEMVSARRRPRGGEGRGRKRGQIQGWGGNAVEQRAGGARLEAAAARFVYHGLCSVMVCYHGRVCFALCTFR